MRLLHSKLELVVKSGFIYVPLLFDSSIAREIQGRSDLETSPSESAPGESNSVIESEGTLFVKSVNIQSMLNNFEVIDRDGYQRFRKDCLRGYEEEPGLGVISSDKLLTILLKIMPHFVRKGSGFKRRRLNDEELLDLICGRIEIPAGFIEQADRYLDSRSLQQALNDLDEGGQTLEPLQDGPITSEALRGWFDKALKARILSRERALIERELHERERLGDSKRNHVAALLCIAEKGAFELDGFGFFRIGSSNDYYVYKHTGEYILTDYYARKYRFPDCRVAVPTTRPFRPLVLESYKHPFLPGHAPRQDICLRSYEWPEEFTAENTIQLLEDGINALLYGYDARLRNGYHSLDRTWQYIETIGFDDYRV